jgi:hyperosmotically inducible periplasmic protein
MLTGDGDARRWLRAAFIAMMTSSTRRAFAPRGIAQLHEELIMHAKPAILASVVCAALLAAGCGERSPSDATARNDAATQPRIPPPAVTPPAAATPPSDTAPGAKVADAIADTALTAKVKTALVTEAGLKSTAIEVTTKDAVVTLTGTVESSTERAKARMVAENVQGVKNVVDNLSLKG